MAAPVLGFDASDAVRFRALVRTTIDDRYLGSTLGRVWAIANPLLLLSLFAVVFGVVLESRLPGSDSSLAFVIWLVSGYAPWLAIVESLNAATASVIGSADLVKNVAFRSETLPLAATVTGTVPLTVGFAFLAVLLAIDGSLPDWHVIGMVPLLAVQFALVGGVGLALGALNVYVRDVGLVLPNLLTFVLFATPIFYERSLLPRAFEVATLVNPFYLLADGYRRCILEGRFPEAWAAAYLVVTAAAAFATGLAVFRRLSRHFHARL